jgi:hypothetical protein
VTDHDALHHLEQYRAGLEAEIAILRQLDTIAARQRDVTETRDFEQLARESDVRDRLTRTLVTIEKGVREVRDALNASKLNLSRFEAFQQVVTLRHTAAELVQRILKIDHDSMKALGDAELARRAALASLERGETTLAAYRRVIAPPVSNAALVDRRG